MRVKLIKIGNSLGIRLPKPVILECDFKDELDLEVYQKTVVLSQPKLSRQGWRSAASEVLKTNPDAFKGAKEWQWDI